MQIVWRLTCFCLLLSSLLLVGSKTAAFADTPPRFTALLFTKTAGFRHPSIVDGVAAIETLASSHNFTVVHSEDATLFNDDDLAAYDVVIFLSTTGDFLNDTQQAAFERYIGRGGGFAGIHAATDAEPDWAWYGELVGAFFANHPPVQTAVVGKTAVSHPATWGLPNSWSRTDEWYNFDRDPSPHVDVLLTVDETTYNGGKMGPHHPISWSHHFAGGRSWYTAMGHAPETYHDPQFQQHLLGGILWAADAVADSFLPVVRSAE